MPQPATHTEARPHAKAVSKRRRWLPLALLLVLVVAVVAVVFTVYQALQARAALSDAADSLQRVRAAVAENDTDAAQRALRDAQESTTEARDNTRGPVWWLAARSPGVGDDVSAVRTVAEVSDEVTHLVLPGLLEASRSLEPADLQPQDGRINVDAIEHVAPAVVEADRALTPGAERVAAIDSDALVDQIAGPVSDFQAQIAEVHTLTDRAAKAVRLLPPMLGSEGRRTYLVLFQNNAESRATGGIPGAVAVVTAVDGRIDLVQQGTAGDLGAYDEPVLPLTRDEREVYGPHLARIATGAAFTPDFRRTAELTREMWRRSSGQTVDGVLSADPVALSHLLEGTGPVPVPGGPRLTAGNTVEALLSDVYMQVSDPEQQNEIFAQAAHAVFDAVASGQGDPQAVLQGITQAAEERRLLAWSADEGEQALLSETALAGALPDQPTEAPAVGVFLNDGTGAKMGYYLDHEVTVEPVSCDSDGQQRLRTIVTLRSDAPPNARNFPVSVIGPGFGAKPGTVRVNLLLYAPFGGTVRSVAIDDEPLRSAELRHDGRPVAAQTIDIAPGQEQTVTFDVISGPGQTATPEVRTTPGSRPGDHTEVGPTACG
ncbi:MAG: DUF4012 domain-containing protein [Nocardioidaceae bacterium]